MVFDVDVCVYVSCFVLFSVVVSDIVCVFAFVVFVLVAAVVPGLFLYLFHCDLC